LYYLWWICLYSGKKGAFMFDNQEIKGCFVRNISETDIEIRRKNGFSVMVSYNEKDGISIEDFVNDRVDAFNELMDFLDNQEKTFTEIQDKAIEFWKNLRRIDCWAEHVIQSVNSTFGDPKIRSIHKILWSSYEAYMDLFLEKYPQVNHFKDFLLNVLKNNVKHKCENHVQMP